MGGADLQNLATAPEAQKTGVAKALLVHGLEIVDEVGAEAHLDATPGALLSSRSRGTSLTLDAEGEPVYVKHGFRRNGAAIVAKDGSFEVRLPLSSFCGIRN